MLLQPYPTAALEALLPTALWQAIALRLSTEASESQHPIQPPIQPPVQPPVWQVCLPQEALPHLCVALATVWHPKDIVALVGEIGAGKTTLTHTLGEVWHCPQRITSPTFNLLNDYDLIHPRTQEALTLYHGDVYRLIDTPANVQDAWLGEWLERAEAHPSLSLIEWAEALPNALAHCTTVLHIQPDPKAPETHRLYTGFRLLPAIPTIHL